MVSTVSVDLLLVNSFPLAMLSIIFGFCEGHGGLLPYVEGLTIKGLLLFSS